MEKTKQNKQTISRVKHELSFGSTLSVLRIFARNFEETCRGAPGSGSFRKKMGGKSILRTEMPDYC